MAGNACLLYPQDLGQFLNSIFFVVQSILGLWRFSQLCPKIMDVLPMSATLKGIRSLCSPNVMRRSMA